MRAIVFREHSHSLEVYEYLEDLPVPTIGPEEVLVHVQYAAINRLDNFVRIGWPGLKLAMPHVPCSDFSGTVARVGENVRDWQIGQRVTANPLIWTAADRFVLRGEQNRSPSWHLLGENIPGSCAEYVKVPARNLIAVPETYSMQKAAAASLVFVTAWHSLIRAGGLRPGERVLVVGAGGGVNSAAIQVARLAGAIVFVVASSAAKARLAEEIGADWVHDRSQDQDWNKAIYHATDREGVDLVVDNVGKETWASSLRALRPGGRLVTVGGTSGYEAVVPVNLIFMKHLSIIGSTMGTQDDYNTVMRQVFGGRLEVKVDSVFPMREYRAAMARMLAGQHFGKIVIEVTPAR